MRSIAIGLAGKAQEILLDVARVIEGRMLIAANSGGGKSMLLRLIVELCHEFVQIIILDKEGEFSTLKEVAPRMVLFGRDGDRPTELKTAELLAKKLMQKPQISAIIDLSDLTKDDMRMYVKRFLEAMMAVPRKYWHPVLVIIDEVHEFCPNVSRVESSAAVISLMSQGRKRGFAGLLATQRMSKIHKDAASECNNVFIGRTFQDIDRQRAADVLGISKAESMSLRHFKPGQFYAVGSAFSSEGLMTANKAQSTHPEPGKRYQLEAHSSASVDDLLAELGDLPFEARAEEDQVLSLRGQIAELESENRRLQSSRPKAEKVVERVEVPVIDEKFISEMKTLVSDISRYSNDARFLVEEAEAKANQLVEMADNYGGVAMGVVDRKIVERAAPVPDSGTSRKGVNAVLAAVAQFGPCGAERIVVNTRYKPSSVDTYLRTLTRNGLVEKSEDGLSITEAGRAELGEFEPLPAGEALREYWRNGLAAGELSIFQYLEGNYPSSADSGSISHATKYTRSSVETYLRKMKRRGIVVSDGRAYSLHDDLFAEDR